MKAALLTFHNAYNYGAALQALGLQAYLTSTGVDCEHINYVNHHRRNAYNTLEQARLAWKAKKPKRAAMLLAGTPVMKKRGRAFDKFYQKYLKQTETVYTSCAEAQALQDQYDKFIVGSDQVWNTGNNGGDLAYLLDFVSQDDKKISYASSFGSAVLSEDVRADYVRCLSRIGSLSTRERYGADLIRKLTGRRASVVVDPVFLPDVSFWEGLIPSKKPEGEHIFFYTNSQRQIQTFLSTGYNVKGTHLDILSTHITVKDVLRPSVRFKVAMAPEEFLWEIKHAKLVVSASFHCLAFAILFKKPFVAILSGDVGRDERLLNLLRMAGLEDRVLTPKTTEASLAQPINYNAVTARLKKHIANSKTFLERALNSEAMDIETEEGDFASESAEMTICPAEACTGCGACAQVCPAGVISMDFDGEGFRVPRIDQDLCTRCNLCKRVCQYHEDIAFPDFKQRYFAAKNKDEVRACSSSGGLFTAISDVVLNQGGAIAAAVMRPNFVVEHALAFTREERDRMRHTHYVQSDTSQIYIQVQEQLENGKLLLFVGTPCQVAGLRNFLRKPYSNLITADLVCHGAPSPGAFAKFIEYIKGKKPARLTAFYFRDKSLGWHGYNVSAEYGSQKVIGKRWLKSFRLLFSRSSVNRLSCASCPYSNYNRKGDLTMGDFWGIERALPDFADQRGISLLLVNTSVGEQVLNACEGLELREVEKEQTRQNSLTKPKAASPNRRECLRMIMRGDYPLAAKRYGEVNAKGWVKDKLRWAYGKIR